MMKTLRFSIRISAPKEIVWKSLWGDTSFRDWADTIDEGMYMEGTMKKGSEVHFMSSVNGYGVKSLVEKLVPHAYVLFRHKADTKELGKKERAKEWTGGWESYALTENNGTTTLTIETEVPAEQEETFDTRLPRALERIKALAEKRVDRLE